MEDFKDIMNYINALNNSDMYDNQNARADFEDGLAELNEIIFG